MARRAGRRVTKKVDSKKRPSKRPPKRRPVVAIAAAMGLALVLGVSVYLMGIPATRFTGDAAFREIEFSGNESVDEAIQKLGTAHLVDGAPSFESYARVRGIRPRAGAHWLSGNLSISELISRVEGGGQRIKVTFPEGLNRFEMADRLAKTGVCSRVAFVKATQDAGLLAELHVEGDSLEGMLFPATYELPADMAAADIAKRLKAEFDKRISAIDKKASSRPDMTTRELVTLASLVEKEAAVDEDRPLVASVFVNRLTKTFTPRLLQCDPTSAYGCVVARETGAPLPRGCANFAGKPTHDTNQDPTNAYSTYTHEKLPPGPIANPGVKSLAAAFSPADTAYLYFFAKGGQKHEFSTTYEEHQAVIRSKR